MQDTTKKIADRLGCRYQIFDKGSDPALVEKAYHKALAAGKDGGFYPAVICLDEYATEWLLEEDMGAGLDRQELIEHCQDNGQEILRERYAEYTEEMEEDELDDFIGTETEGDALDEFISYCSFQDGMLEAETLLLEIPVKHPWEIIAYLPMGGWNDCPAPDEMMAVCKYWYEKYQALPAVFTHDVMEFYAPEGLNGVDSLEAAKEHYAFCTDRIHQGTRTYKVSELAAGLEQSRVWYFWWD